VSHQVRALEARLGLELFERHGRTLRLTPAGERLLELAHELLAPLARAELELKRAARPKRQTLRVGSQCFTAYHWLPQAYALLAEQHPEVELSLVADAANEVPAAFDDDRLDLALCVSCPRSRELSQRELFRDELVLAVPRGHPLGRRKYVDGADLAGETLVLTPTSAAERERVLRVLCPRGAKFGRVIRIPVAEAVVELVAAGVGLSIVPSFMLGPYLERAAIEAVRLTPRGLSRVWHGAYRKASPLTPAIDSLLDLLQQHAPRRPRSRAGN
jgi:LysR family transcriptional regulator for metE and metH